MDSQTQKLLGAVVKNTQMCQTTLNKLIGITKDAELKKKIHEQLATHEDISNRARAMLAADGCEVKPESAMAKMSAQMGIAMKTMRDASSRNLAQMMIEGNHMGVTDLTMAIKEAENANPGAVALAQRLQHAENGALPHSGPDCQFPHSHVPRRHRVHQKQICRFFLVPAQHGIAEPQFSLPHICHSLVRNITPFF